MPKIVDKEKMMQLIISSALQVFAEHGVNNASMNNIAQEMGVAKGTLYRYFGSKEELIKVITDLHFQKLKKRLIPENYFHTLEDFLLHMEQALLISEEDSIFIPVFFEIFGPSFSSTSFVKTYKVFFDELGYHYSKNLQLLLENGSIKNNISPEHLGRILVSMLDGIMLHKGFFQISNHSYKNMVKEAIELFRRGLNHEE